MTRQRKARSRCRVKIFARIQAREGARRSSDSSKPPRTAEAAPHHPTRSPCSAPAVQNAGPDQAATGQGRPKHAGLAVCRPGGLPARPVPGPSGLPARRFARRNPRRPAPTNPGRAVCRPGGSRGETRDGLHLPTRGGGEDRDHPPSPRRPGRTVSWAATRARIRPDPRAGPGRISPAERSGHGHAVAGPHPPWPDRHR